MRAVDFSATQTAFWDAHLLGLRAGGFLAVNLMLHLASVLLVFALARCRIEIIGALIAAILVSWQTRATARSSKK